MVDAELDDIEKFPPMRAKLDLGTIASVLGTIASVAVLVAGYMLILFGT